MRGKGCFAHGGPVETYPCVGRAVWRTASPPDPSRAWKGRFCARRPCLSRPVRGKGCLTHGIPAGVRPVRRKGCLTHGDSAETVPCVERAVSRTATLPESSRAWKGRFCARRPCRFILWFYPSVPASRFCIDMSYSRPSWHIWSLASSRIARKAVPVLCSCKSVPAVSANHPLHEATGHIPSFPRKQICKKGRADSFCLQFCRRSALTGSKALPAGLPGRRAWRISG